MFDRERRDSHGVLRSCVGLLEHGRGLAATPLGVDDPGRCHTSEDPLENWKIGDRVVTDRAGVSEHTNWAANTVAMYASPAGRRRYGSPQPVDTSPDNPDVPPEIRGKEVFDLQEIDEFAKSRRRRTTPSPPAARNADEPVDWREFARMHGLAEATMRRHIEDSLPAWDQDKDGSIPRPDAGDQDRADGAYRRRGRPPKYLWKRGTAAAWKPRTPGRKPGPRPQVEDLEAILRGHTGARPPTLVQLAQALTERVGDEVSVQTVRRLRRQLADRKAGPPQRR
jgi:hypothetical protein